MGYKRYNIAIIPPRAIIEQAIAMSEELRKFDSFFVLDEKTLSPHISLYHAPFTEERLGDVIGKLEEITAGTRPFPVRHASYYPDQGVWVGIRYVSDKAILDLHTQVIEATKGYRAEQDDVRYLARWAELSHQQRENIKDCGWTDSFTLFSPHLTFTKLRQPRTDVLHHLPEHDFSFQVDHIALVERGEYGACIKTLADFTLKK